jgi:putative SOS response-associated peptidase YedK
MVRSSPREVIARELDVDPPDELDLRPRWNLCPGEDVLAVVEGYQGRRIGALRWGLVPSFAADTSGGTRAINARAETIAARPAFRDAFRRRRCLVVADAFYEWRREDGRRVPYCFRPAGGGLLTFAGVWERWRSPEGGSLETCAVVTCPANALVGAVHDRMPVVLAGPGRDRWLDRDCRDPAALQALLRPAPADALEGFEVAPLVNSPRNDVPECVRPVGGRLQPAGA